MKAKLLYSITETVEVLGVGRTTIYGLIGEGKLQTVKIGRRTLVTAESISRLAAPHAANDDRD